MRSNAEQSIETGDSVAQLTRDWGNWSSVSFYLGRSQVDTPPNLVDATWAHVKLLRGSIGKVVDFGAGDGRFSVGGSYREYVGYEIDDSRFKRARLPDNATLVNRCAFSDEITDADLCIGNPPFVRNQDLPTSWRQRVSDVLQRRTGITVSGLGNAWQYFFLQALASLNDDGLSALIVPYEWVSRPSARALRDYIREHRWNVKVYRLVDTRFDNVLTTSSITIVDKAQKDGEWAYFEETHDGCYLPLKSASGTEDGVIEYLRRKDISSGAPRAVRGLSPGTQKVLTLTEGERVRNGLEIDRDVVVCVTSLRHLPVDTRELDDATFNRHYRERGQKCWLIRTDRNPSPALSSYIDAVPASEYQTVTCLERAKWWKFHMPPVPAMLVAQGFKDEFPKRVRNRVQARAVGGVCGIYDVNDDQICQLAGGLGGIDLRDRVVAYSNGFRKIEINQLNALLRQAFGALKTDE